MAPVGDAISISEAKTQLSKLVARAERGEEVQIRRGPHTVVKLVAINPPPRRRGAVVGALRGQIEIAGDADELGPEWDPYR